jgi:site-specific DNA recombinase
MNARPLQVVVPVATYARYSTDRQDARSIEDQLRRCEAYATEQRLAVIETYNDAATSGAHTEREGLKRLLRDAKLRRFEAVLVDDLSRLSRDLGATWRLVFEEMAALRVRVIDCSTNMASDSEGARLLFGVKALVNDEFLQNVRRQTHRGLEGRALAGFHTGGKTYGYRTVTEPNPPDPEHPRKVPQIDLDEAAIVLRIFHESAAGASTQTIASRLNDDGIAAPHDGGRGNKGNRGWGHTTIRAMLRNDRYIGVSRWNQCRWMRVPGQRTRSRVERPETEHLVREYPDLRIVPDGLWQAVQERRRRTSKRQGGRTAGATRVTKPSLLSGLLRCGLCAGSMTVRSQVQKRGKLYRCFGCTSVIAQSRP